MVNSQIYEAIANEDAHPEDEPIFEQRPRIANRMVAKSLNQYLESERQRIDGLLLAERNARRERMYMQIEHEPFLEPEEKEEKIYLEQLEERKRNNTSSQRSTNEFLPLLRPEAEDGTSKGQTDVEAHCLGEGKVYSTPFQNKISMLDQSSLVCKSRRRNLNLVEKKKSRQTTSRPWTSLQSWTRTIRTSFLSLWRSTHAQTLNFFKYRNANTAGHPNARFDIDEAVFVETYCDLYFQKPTQKTMTYGCDDHRLKMASDERNSQRSLKAKELFEERKELLRDTVYYGRES